jgi:predicted aminopeptidase
MVDPATLTSRRGGAQARGLMLAAALVLVGCAHSPASPSSPVENPLAYYWQSAQGHLRMLVSARPLPDWIEDERTPPSVKAQLALAQRIRAFASESLGLPDNASYTRYADLQRPAALWNLVAAPPLSLQLKTWCYPVTGCVGYQGWFDIRDAQREAARLRAQGLDVAVYPVPAYSTLGWSNWLGGDPLLNTFIGAGEGELARLVFHELAHQLLYVKDDTAFNESFATAVERLGVARWMARGSNQAEAARQAYAEGERRRAQFQAIKREARARLAQVYSEPVLSADERLARKGDVLARLRSDWQTLRDRWGGDVARFTQTDRWIAEANNASLAAEAAYDGWVPAFEALFAREVGSGEDWRPFYAAAQRLAALPRPARDQALEALIRTGK